MPCNKPSDHLRDTLDPNTPWNLGDVDNFALPKAHGNPWQRCLDPILREDKLKCQAWNEEVQTLLIFAGLFSAVVTAFVIQSYQDLQQLPANQVIGFLLASYVQVANNSSALDSQFSNMALALATRRSHTSSVRVNIVWFLSLIMSLTTVLVGIIAMQWIREYQRYSDSSSAKRKLAIRNMRTDGLERWKVPQIIAGLPLLLQTAVILFFVGLIDFLVNISIVIAVPAIIVISISLIFIFMTIMLPALQCLWIVNANIPEHQISQCPYKSPQAWTFIHALSQPWLRWYIIPVILFPPAMVAAIILPFGLLIGKVFGISSRPLDTPTQFLLKFLKNVGKAQLSSWDTFDGVFLKRRQQIVLKNEYAEHRTNRMANGLPYDFDVSMSIAHLVNEHVYDKSLARAAYDCFHELPPPIITNNFLTSKEILRMWIPHERSLRISDVLPPSLDHGKAILRQLENEILFLENLFHPLEQSALVVLRCRQLELFVRMVGHIFTDTTYIDHPENGNAEATATVLANTLRRSRHQGLLVPSVLMSTATIQMIPQSTCRGVTLQLLTIFKTFAEQMIKSDGRNVSVFCQREDLLVDFMRLIYIITLAGLFRNRASSQPLFAADDPFLEQSTSVMALLASHIRPTMPSKMNILFYSAVLFVCHFRIEELDLWQDRFPEFVACFRRLVLVLQAYEKSRIHPIKFLVRHTHHYAQWERLVDGVVSSSSKEELQAAVASSGDTLCAEEDGPSEDCMMNTPLTGSPTAVTYSISIEKCDSCSLDGDREKSDRSSHENGIWPGLNEFRLHA